MEKHSFRIVSGDLPKPMRKLCLSTKYYTRKLGEITLFSVVAVSFFPLTKKFSEKIPSIFFPIEHIQIVSFGFKQNSICFRITAKTTQRYWLESVVMLGIRIIKYADKQETSVCIVSHQSK